MAVNKPNVTTYQEFRGVDYSASPAVISEVHAQDMLNMYIGEDGVLQKRPGWHILNTFLNVVEFSSADTYAVGDYVKYSNKFYKCTTEHTGAWDASDFEEAVPPRLPINGIHYISYGVNIGYLFIHAGTRLYGVMFTPGLRHIVNRDNDPGDVPFYKYDGDVPTPVDAVNIVRYVEGYNDGWDDWQVKNMDVDGDGKITNKDASVLLNLIVGLSVNASNGVLASSYFLVPDENGAMLEMSAQRSVSFTHEGKLYILDGDHYYVVEPQYASGNPMATGFVGKTVEGYIPTTGVNGHYEYQEMQTETTTGSTIVAKTTVTLGTGESSAQFTALESISGKRFLVSVILNSRCLANGRLVKVGENATTFKIRNLLFTYTTGLITVTSTSTRALRKGDKITLFIKNEDEEIAISGEPGSETNPGEWKAPEKDEERNLLQTKQIQTMTADGIHNEYYLTENACDIHKVELLLWTRCKSVDGVDTPTQEHKSDVDAGTYTDPQTGVSTYYYYKYVWTEVASNHATYGWTAADANSSTDAQGDVSYSTCITFTNVLEAHKDGLPNIRVTFTPQEHSTSSAAGKDRGYIEKCTIVTRFGYFNSNRFWFAGNPDYKNMDHMSAVDDPTYFPASGWTKIGSDMTAIQGYLRYGSELAIIKEDNGQDATVYMRSANVSDDGNVYFPVQQGAQGVGAISKYCLKTLKDEPLYLAKEGVYAIQGTDASQERTIPNRSFYIDKKLQQEATPACVAEVFQNYYIVANPTTGHCFVADARYQGLPPGTNDRQHGYEWFVWDNVPAKVFCATDDYLFFGTQDGRLCVFNFDWDHPKRWTDGAEFVNGSTVWHKWHPYDNGYQIHAYYVTKRDHLAAMDFKKTMLNDGGVIVLEPHEQSSASITVTTDKGTWFVDHVQTDSDEPSVVIPIRHRFKYFDSIETRIENNEIREGLSILGIQYRYYLGTNRR